MNYHEDLSGLKIGWRWVRVVWVSYPLRAGSALKLVRCQVIRIGSFVKLGNLKHNSCPGSSEFAMQNTRTGVHYPINHCSLGRVHNLAT